MMRRVKISLLAVDESHCISQWGASFRPECVCKQFQRFSGHSQFIPHHITDLKIARFAEELSVERVLCLTATATPEVATDICRSFHIDPSEGVFKTPVYRPK